MRKVFGFIVFVFLFFSLGLFSHSKLYAQNQGCQLTIDPSNVSPNYKGPITITSQECFPDLPNYKVIALPAGMSLNEAFPSGITQTERDEGIIKPVWDRQPERKDYNTIIANLKSSFDSAQPAISKYLKRRSGSSSGDWTVLVCNQKDKGFSIKIDASAECPTIGSGIINVGLTPLTPTPTPESDQPIIDPIHQSQCTFQVGKEIQLTATNIDSSKKYHWWWTEGRGEEAVIPSCYPELDSSCSTSFLQFIIPGNETLNRQTTEKNPDGDLLCIDLEEKKCVGANQKPPCAERTERKKRTGANCIRFFFKNYNPNAPETKIDTSCSINNAGDITPIPKSPLPPCGQWARLNGTPIPTVSLEYNDPDFQDRKCTKVSTGIGNINTDPFGLVKSILSILLSLSGGIAVILIIVAGFRLMLSQGNPEAVQAAREQLTSAIVGFLFIIFSLVILQVIGVDILKIPGFTK